MMLCTLENCDGSRVAFIKPTAFLSSDLKKKQKNNRCFVKILKIVVQKLKLADEVIKKDKDFSRQCGSKDVSRT